MKYLLLLSFIIISFLIVNGGLFSQDKDRGYIVKTGQLAPDFEAKLIDGTTFKLSENRGKTVMLQFTASWCGVCRKEMPFIESEIWDKNKGKDFVLIGIDRDEPLAVVENYIEKMNITYPVALDPEAKIFSLYAKKNAGVTRNIIIDKDGKIVFLTRLFARDEFDEMKKMIDNLLKDQTNK